MSEYLPLLLESSEKSIVAFYNGRNIFKDEFLEHINQACKILPHDKYCINLCENRYHFLVVFAACVILKQTSLLPSSRAEKEIERLRKKYKDNYLVNDQDIEETCQNNLYKKSYSKKNYSIEKDSVVAIVFTSGSTGKPKANKKTWSQLYESAIRVKQRFKYNEDKQHSLIATIPPQHMFGFETTILYPLVLGVAIHAGRPFYPQDIQKALLEIPPPHVLITTPIHLKACTSENSNWPDINFIISATAKMPSGVASKAEKILNTYVLEIYGCSEAGAIATRQMTKNTKWHLLKDYKLTTKNKVSILNAPGFDDDIEIPDQLELYGDGYFSLVGRNSDLINIGGKRGSINDLTYKLKAIDGVTDAVFVFPEEEQGKRGRLTAFVITSEHNEKTLRKELLKCIDPVFLPRPLIIVEQLPYNELGKLPRTQLMELLNQHRNKTIYQEIT